MGMDVAAWVYGMGTAAAGFGYQIKYAKGALDAIILPFSLQTSLILITVLFTIFVAVQVIARKGKRPLGIAVAMIIFPIIVATGWTALTLADRAGISLA